MKVTIEHLELLPKIFNEIKALKLTQAMQSDKRWLNTRKLSDYLGYSLDAINKMVKENVFAAGVHYHKPQGKLLFDKEQIDNWVMGVKNDSDLSRVNEVVESILQGIK